jgi:lysophospholipase L1-like esterase
MRWLRRLQSRTAMGAGVLVCAALGAPADAPAAASAAAAPSRQLVWMSAGDSYSAGEGIGDQVVDEACARSRKAYGPVAARLLRDQRGWRTSREVFVACTGDVSADFFEPRPADGSPPNRPSQLRWAADQGLAGGMKADVVLFSFGGNDIGFANVLTDCLGVPDKWWKVPTSDIFGDRCRPVDGKTLREGMIERIDAFVEQGRIAEVLYAEGSKPQRAEGYGGLANFYKRVLDERVANDGVLVVVGYPRIFAPNEKGQWGDWRGDRCSGISAEDAKDWGEVAEYLDGKLSSAVAAAEPTGRRIVYVPRLGLYDGKGDFGSHSLCGGNTEWLNRLTIGVYDPALRYQRSFHPNEPGHAATAELVASTLDTWATAVAAPSTTAQLTTATTTQITTGRTFQIGDSFSARCVVAWPTAPQRSRSGTDMRMSCLGVPKQFLFVDVPSDDRNLPITPSTGHVQVTGRILDVAESEHGFRVLVVYASRVDIPSR